MTLSKLMKMAEDRERISGLCTESPMFMNRVQHLEMRVGLLGTTSGTKNRCANVTNFKTPSKVTQKREK